MAGLLTLALTPGTRPNETEAWVSPEELADCSAGSQVDLATVCQVATDILFQLSGRQFGVRQEKVRPEGFGDCWSRGPVFYVEELVLRGPVRQIDQVKIDGAVVSPNNYRLYGRALRRTDRMAWPVYQDLSRADTEQDTMSVTYQWGSSVPVAAAMAAKAFACQLAGYMAGDKKCALPDRVMTVTRQGVSKTIIDPKDFFQQARTGLYLVDMWLASVNPTARRMKSTISGPDGVRLRRDTLDFYPSYGSSWNASPWNSTPWS